VYVWSFFLTGASAAIRGQIRVLGPNGECVWCEQFSGTAVVGGAQIGSYVGVRDGGSWLNYSFSDVNTVPEPGAFGVAGLALAVGAWIRVRRS
jgi:hypothetical protein